MQAPATVEAWCLGFLESDRLAGKLAPPPPPRLDLEASWEVGAEARRIAAPTRPSELRVVARGPKSPTRNALRDAAVRARLLHTLAHHELQAAELFCWAVLAFPDTPRAFRRGLVRLALEELEHLELYRAHMAELGVAFGDHPVRDWFWDRIPDCPTALHFVAFMGLGFEGCNLEHSARYAAWFRAAGDERGGAILERVERDEIGHVAFARTWCETFTGAALDFDTWTQLLPTPISPALLRGVPLNVAARRMAGLDDEFLARLAAAPKIDLSVAAERRASECDGADGGA